MITFRPPLRHCTLPLLLSMIAACSDGGTTSPGPAAAAPKASTAASGSQPMTRNSPAATALTASTPDTGAAADSPMAAPCTYVAPRPTPVGFGPDPLLNRQWYLYNDGTLPGTVAGEDLRINNTWVTGRGEGVRVAVLDTGLELTHEDLLPNVVAGASYNYGPRNRGNSLPFPCTNADEHGTSVAGLIAGRDYNGKGMVGVASRASLVGYNILDTDTDEDILDGIVRDLKHNAIYNNSWGPAGEGHFESAQPSDKVWQRVINHGLHHGRRGLGAIYVFAAGNDALSGDYASYDGYTSALGITAVCATNASGKRAAYSEPGANLLVCAPSNDYPLPDRPVQPGVTTTKPQNSYTDSFGGTSAAAPMVSGVVALMLQANPNLSWRDVKLILAYTARKVDLGSAGWADYRKLHYNHEYGFGVVNTEAAVHAARTWRSVGTSKHLQQCGPYRIDVGQTIPQHALQAAPDLNQAPTEGLPTSITIPPNCPIRHIEHTRVRMTVRDAQTDARAGDPGSLQITLTAPTAQTATLTLPHACFEPRDPESTEQPARIACRGLEDFSFGISRFLEQPAYTGRSARWTLTAVDRNVEADAQPAQLKYWELTLYGR